MLQRKFTLVTGIWFAGMLALQSARAQTPIFRELPPDESGIHWTHDNGWSEQHYMPESSGAGVAIFDYNNDGWMDILLVDSGTSSFYKPPTPLHPVLYRNNGDGSYADVSSQAGLGADLFGHGVAIADYDGDGFEDIFITGFGKCVLYHNAGNGTFTDVTASSGIAPTQWGTSAAWLDYDNDGKLDLFVGEFADYSNLQICFEAESSARSTPGEQTHGGDYCPPQIFRSEPSKLYRNLGQGKFADVSQSTGIGGRPGKAWGVVAADINGDGFTDLFVSNDTTPNNLWMNRGGKKFQDMGAEAGVAYSNEGVPRSGMGVDAADFDQDGRPDLVVGNIDDQTTSLYRNLGREMFDEINRKTGVSQATRTLSGWGLRFFDYDNDGWLDLILAHGHPNDRVGFQGTAVAHRQPIVLLHNLLGAKVEDVSKVAGTTFHQKYSARGLAVGDLNNDGKPDIVFTENGGPVHILMNEAQSGNNWLGLTLKPSTTNPDAVGAVIVWRAGGKIFTRVKTGGGSYLSSQDPREILGVGKGKVEWVEVRWPRPSHRVDRITEPEMNRYMVTTEGPAGASKTATHGQQR
jgi:hypothetical protein